MNHLKPFAPESPEDIKLGMRVLVTRTSGRVGKGIVMWKGSLPGHNDTFLGVELETSSKEQTSHIMSRSEKV